MSKEYRFSVNASDRAIFDAIKTGKKKVETRAWSVRYKNLAKGDSITFVCGKSKVKKKIVNVQVFKSLHGLLRAHKPKDINPAFSTAIELRKMYASFPNYTEKVKKHGLIALHLK